MIQRLRAAERLFSRAQRFTAQQRSDEALQALQRAVTMQPHQAGFLLHWARALAEAGHLAEAHQAMQRAMQLQPTNPVLPMFLAQMYFDHADYGATHVWCERAASLNPLNPHVIALQALSALVRGDIAQGCQRLQQALPRSLTPLEAWVLRAGKRPIPSVLGQCSTSMQSRVLLIAETYLRQHAAQGRTLFQQLAVCRDAEMSRASYRVMVALDRVCTRLIMGGQRLYVRARYAGREERPQRLQRLAAAEAYYLGDTATALSQYNALLSHLTEQDELSHRLFELYYEQADAPRALTHLRRLLGPANEPNAWQALCLGELLCQTGQWSEAASYFDRAQTLRLRDYKVPYYLGLCCMHAGLEREARQHFGRALTHLNPGLCALRLDEVYRVFCATSDTQASSCSADKI